MTSNSENQITRSDLIKSAVNTGALGMEFSWTYYKQMNIAFCLMVANMLKKIYAGRPDDYAEALHRHSAFFNITPQLAITFYHSKSFTIEINITDIYIGIVFVYSVIGG